MVSRLFWTPAPVVLRAASLLARVGTERVLDVGSGVGKFCTVGALSTGATFVGIERRHALVREAKMMAWLLGAVSARFVHGTLDDVDIHDFDGVYFFNPFEENLWKPKSRLDEAVPMSERRFYEDVFQAEAMLDRARPGTRLVTYHGFGGKVPPSYRLVLREPCHSDFLEFWVREQAPATRLRSRTSRSFPANAVA
jgi:hypothetical protein